MTAPERTCGCRIEPDCPTHTIPRPPRAHRGREVAPVERIVTRHTPGPWTNQRQGREAFICGDARHVASVPTEDEQDEANARLIAAAPEMLALIRATLIGTYAGIVWEKSARALLARIEGETP